MNGPTTSKVVMGTKHDQDRPDLTLAPRVALLEMAKAFTFGRGKYGLNNYREPGLTARRCLRAALSHIHAVIEGEQEDKESDAHHLGHALASCAMAMWMIATRGPNIDDDGSMGSSMVKTTPSPMVAINHKPPPHWEGIGS